MRSGEATTMHRLILAAAIMLGGTLAAGAQPVPHDFRQDTPPVPGQVVETPREKLRIAPNPQRTLQTEPLGLPSSGPKGVIRESSNEAMHAPPLDR
jgi:hypothetical protein